MTLEKVGPRVQKIAHDSWKMLPRGPKNSPWLKKMPFLLVGQWVPIHPVWTNGGLQAGSAVTQWKRFWTNEQTTGNSYGLVSEKLRRPHLEIQESGNHVDYWWFVMMIHDDSWWWLMMMMTMMMMMMMVSVPTPSVTTKLMPRELCHLGSGTVWYLATWWLLCCCAGQRRSQCNMWAV